MVATEIRLDLNGKKGPDLWARLGESDTRQIVMHPGYYDPEGNWTPLIIDAENIFAKFRIVKPDNTFVIQDASLYLPSDPSIFVVTLPETATQVAGLGYYDLRIGDGETPDTFLYSAGGRFIVDDDMITDEMIESVASVNGLIFPDDFLTSADLSAYATKEYVDESIAAIPDPLHTYSDTEEQIIGTWIDGSTIYEKTFTWTLPNTSVYTSQVLNLPASTNNAWIDQSASYATGIQGTSIYRCMWSAYATGVYDLDAKGYCYCDSGTWKFDYRVGSYLYGGTSVLTVHYTKS